MKNTVLETFTKGSIILPIMRQNPDTRIVTKPNHQIIYMENRWERFVAADRWGMTVPELEEFMSIYGEGYSYTSPSAFSYSLYRKQFSNPDSFRTMVLPIGDFRARLCSDSIYGGRCEVFQYGMEYLYQYDINSSYPYTASILNLPYPKSMEYQTLGTIRNIHDYEGVSRIVFSQEHMYPVLPVRWEGRTIYPNTDSFVGTYTHNELRYAMDNGVKIIAVLKQFIALRMLEENPFTRFVDYCYNMRVTTGLKIYKRIANGLFGRLATTNTNLLTFTAAHSKEQLRSTEPRLKDFFGCACVGKDTPAPPNSNPLWAAMILSGSRTRLHKYARYAVYLDTDCVFTKIPLDVVVSNDLGDWKLKQGWYDIRGAKQYMYTSDNGEVELKLKGVDLKWRKLSDFFAARYTQERTKMDNGSTLPLEVSLPVGISYNKVGGRVKR